MLECMIDERVDGYCILAHCSEQFPLSVQECDILVDLSLAHVGSRKAVMITCKHFSTQFAIERTRYAAARGASLLMLMPPYHGLSLNADAPRCSIVSAVSRMRPRFRSWS
ncbi:dihydrodipicolinate synthase/N-acetylneuraminate lyase [Bradyrhizobium sp. LM2.3]